MNSVKQWFDENVDKKQLTTIVMASVAIGGSVYLARKAGLNTVATIAKGGK